MESTLRSVFIPGLAVILFIIALILIRTTIRAFHGRRYSNVRVVRLPAVYIILSVFAVLINFAGRFFYYSILLLIPAGYVFGSRFAGQAQFFYRSDVLYYRRSPVIFIIWLSSFLARIFLQFVLPDSFVINIIIDSVLSFTAGLLLGESINLIVKKRQMTESRDINADVQQKNY
ncbi:hypothetical protein [Thermoplasma sp.]|uniref:hypothetical protein n=1 Tax=Thermoplasma sp. TaxID=1973142 RepID=UPI0026389095|nr:hypothetical protein [Thermoplasma sp.]